MVVCRFKLLNNRVAKNLLVLENKKNHEKYSVVSIAVRITVTDSLLTLVLFQWLQKGL